MDLWNGGPTYTLGRCLYTEMYPCSWTGVSPSISLSFEICLHNNVNQSVWFLFYPVSTACGRMRICWQSIFSFDWCYQIWQRRAKEWYGQLWATFENGPTISIPPLLNGYRFQFPLRVGSGHIFQFDLRPWVSKNTEGRSPASWNECRGSSTLQGKCLVIYTDFQWKRTACYIYGLWLRWNVSIACFSSCRQSLYIGISILENIVNISKAKESIFLWLDV